MNPKDGLLVIGGYDQARVNGPFSNFSVGNWSLDTACPLQVTITNASFGGTSLMNGTQNIIACVEPAAYKTVFPPAVAKQFGIASSQNTALFPKGFQYDASKRPTGNLTITLAGGYQTTIPNDELFLPLRGSDKNGRFAIVNDTIQEAQVTDTRNSDPHSITPTLGGQFLTYNYLVVDYKIGQFRMAPAVPLQNDNVNPKPTTICTPADSSNTPAPSSSKHTGAVVGGIVGAVGGLALIACLVFCLLRRRKPKVDSNTRALSALGAPYGTQDGIHPPQPVLHRQLSEMDGGHYEQKAPIYEMPTYRYSGIPKPDVIHEVGATESK